MIKIGVPGVSGRMGAAIAQQVLRNPDLSLTAATVRVDNKLLDTLIPNSNLIISAGLTGRDIDVLIDFTLPEGVLYNIDYCLQHNIAMVIGATGFTPKQLDTVKAAAKLIPIVQSYNMSVGVNICYKLLTTAAKLLDDSWNVEVSDLHHKHKIDSPSGTAKEIANILATNGNRDLDTINIISERNGDVVGDHTVTFSNPLETITIAHHAIDRNIFAAGAIKAAQWIYGKQPGLYTMQDVIA